MSSEQKQEQPEASQANTAPSTEPSQETHTTTTEVKKLDLGEIQTTTETFTTYIEPETISLASKVPMSLASSQEPEVVLETL